MIYQIGDNRFRHGSAMESLDELMQGKKANIFYCDPPWGEGNMKYWQTMKVKQNPGEVRQDLELLPFLKRIFEIAVTHSDGPIYMAYGMRWEQHVLKAAAYHGLKRTQVGEWNYCEDMNCHVHLFRSSQKVDMSELLYWDRLLDPFLVPGGVVLDPCCGNSKSRLPQYVIENGMSFYANEMNLHRLKKTMSVAREYED